MNNMNDHDNHNSDIEIIKEQLLSLGAPEQDLDTIIADVNDVAISRALTLYIHNLPDENIKNTLKNMSAAEIVTYIEKHNKELPPLSEKILSDTTMATWTEYFKAME